MFPPQRASVVRLNPQKVENRSNSFSLNGDVYLMGFGILLRAPHVQTRSEFRDRWSCWYLLTKTSICPCSRYHWMATTWLESNFPGWPMLLTYRWQVMPFFLPEAPGSHWGGMVGQNVCPHFDNRPTIVNRMSKQWSPSRLNTLARKLPPYWARSSSVELTNGQAFRHTMSLSQTPLLEVWEQVQILSVAWSFHWRLHFAQNTGAKNNKKKNLDLRTICPGAQRKNNFIIF